MLFRIVRLGAGSLRRVGIVLAHQEKRITFAVQRPSRFTNFNPIIRHLSIKKFDFDKESEETLESLGDRFEELLEDDPRMEESDVSLSNGVLTVVIPNTGTYVVNKQSPNRQIWLSSPKSGPARFDYKDGVWIYSHTNETLHALLDREIGQEILNTQSNFKDCYLGSSEANQ